MHLIWRFVLFFIIQGLAVFSWSQVQVKVESGQQNLNLEFSGLMNWNYDLRQEPANKQVFRLQVPRLNRQSLEALKKLRSDFVESITTEAVDDVSTVLKIQFRQPSIESFDYQTDKPSRLIVDFFKSTNSVAVAAESKEKPQPATAAPEAPKPKAASQRGIASTDRLTIAGNGLASVTQTSQHTQSGIFDGADAEFLRFSFHPDQVNPESVKHASDKEFVDFPMIHTPPEELAILRAKRPTFAISKKENLQGADKEHYDLARLLVTLFERGRYMVFLNTVGQYIEKAPANDPYDEIIRAMWAEAQYQLFAETTRKPEDFELAMFRFRDLLSRYPKSVLAERSVLFMGLASLDRGDNLTALRTFQSHLAAQPQSPNKDLTRLALAEAFLNLRQFEAARAEFDKVIQESQSPKEKVRAAFLKGDVAIREGNLEKAIAEYGQVLATYPNESKQYPNAIYNKGLAEFRTKQYLPALTSLRRFLSENPSHEYAGFAMTRIGEILDILGADTKQVIGAYLETFFRYGQTKSSEVARIRLVRARMSTMKQAELDKNLFELIEMTRKSSLTGMNEFLTLQLAEGLRERKDFEDAYEMLTKFYQENPTSSDTERLRNRIVRVLHSQIQDLVESQKMISAIELFELHRGGWLKASPRRDTQYWVAKAMDTLGERKKSREIFSNLIAASGTPQQDHHESLPAVEELHLKVANSFFDERSFANAAREVEKIKDPARLTPLSQVARVDLLAKLLTEKGDSEHAVRYLEDLMQNWKEEPKFLLPVMVSRAEHFQKNKQYQEAFDLLNKAVALDEKNFAALQLRADVARNGKLGFESEKEALTKLLAEHEKTKPLGSYRFRLGLIHLQKGERAKAEDFWKSLDNPETQTWHQMARQELKDQDWNQEYKKYIQRIPAMQKEVE